LITTSTRLDLGWVEVRRVVIVVVGGGNTIIGRKRTCGTLVHGRNIRGHWTLLEVALLRRISTLLGRITALLRGITTLLGRITALLWGVAALWGVTLWLIRLSIPLRRITRLSVGRRLVTSLCIRRLLRSSGVSGSVSWVG